MYTGRTIEDLLALVLELVERVGDVPFVAPTTTVHPKQDPWNEGERKGQSAGDKNH
jgi:hypothetical protein